jgi:hypothetical protein
MTTDGGETLGLVADDHFLATHPPARQVTRIASASEVDVKVARDQRHPCAEVRLDRRAQSNDGDTTNGTDCGRRPSNHMHESGRARVITADD